MSLTLSGDTDGPAEPVVGLSDRADRFRGDLEVVPVKELFSDETIERAASGTLGTAAGNAGLFARQPEDWKQTQRALARSVLRAALGLEPQ
ncbi:MAG TPA: hypothetical protein VFG23_08465 [Polyangia bacterium]|nr:hypothetical protein [Polyangia bacterium]